MARHFVLAAYGFPFILALIVISGMSKTSTTKWMATAFETLTTKYPAYRNRWISDDKWIDIIRTNYFTPPSKEKEKELKFSRENMVRAIGSRWDNTIEDFTPTNKNGIFRHSYMVSCYDEEGTKLKKGGKLHISMPPNQGETILQNQELPRFLKTKMRWTIT
jgi:hypothetical protein